MSLVSGFMGNGLGISAAFASDLLRMERARHDWLRHIEPAYSVTAQLGKINEGVRAAMLAENSAVAQMARLWQDQQEQVRRMLDPINDIHMQFASDVSLKRLIADIEAPLRASDALARMHNQMSRIGGGAHSNMRKSMEASQRELEKAFLGINASNQLSQLMKSYQDVHKHWVVPKAFVDSIDAIRALQESVGKITLPVIDWTAAATLANLLGKEGMEAQLAALGIQADGTLLEEDGGSARQDKGLGFSRKTMDLLTLLSFIAALLIPYLQELSSNKWQEKTDAELAVQRQLLEKQEKQFLALSRLVELAVEHEVKRAEVRFVVLDRVATVRSDPENGSTVVSKLLPKEVVKPIGEQGKWIEIEYYDWLFQDYRTGWSLKKYFKRVPPTYSR